MFLLLGANGLLSFVPTSNGQIHPTKNCLLKEYGDESERTELQNCTPNLIFIYEEYEEA